MLNIKKLLIEKINSYDKKAGECCQLIVVARLANKQSPNDDHARMVTCIASSLALRHFGVISGLLEIENEEES